MIGNLLQQQTRLRLRAPPGTALSRFGRQPRLSDSQGSASRCGLDFKREGKCATSALRL